MPAAIAIGDTVYVPRSALGESDDGPSPFHRTEVTSRDARSVKVRLRDGSESNWIGTSRVSKNIGVFIVRVGDYAEHTLLDPLMKSVLQFCRMLLPDDQVRAAEVRTREELEFLWNRDHAAYQQVVLIGHGSPSSIQFGTKEVDGAALAAILSAPTGIEAKEIISLCCQTGQAPFAKPLSEANACSELLAPFHSVHGCIASQFCQNYMTLRLLNGQSPGPAFNRTRKNLIGAASFRRWHNGELQAGPT